VNRSERSGIVGVGLAGPFRHQSRPGVELAAQAFHAALADAGLERGQIDGLIVNIGGPAGPDYDQFARFAGLNVSAAFQTWAHGRFTASCVQLADLMLGAGLATHVACVYGYHLDSDAIGGAEWKGWAEENRLGGGPHGEEPAIGLTAPIAGAALATRLYCERYGVHPARLSTVVCGLRKNASVNPSALYRTLLTTGEYLASPLIVDPLRRLDSAPVTEGGACVIVSRDPKVLASARSVYVLGYQALPAGPEEFIWARPGLGIGQQTIDLPFEEPVVFTRAGVTRADVDLFYTYDAFSPLVWFALERFGFAAYGSAPDYLDAEGLTRDARLPINLNGGMLSEGHLSAWGHMVDAVRQLRGEAGDRQARRAHHALWGACYGDAIVFAA
jgi:acetyl-CoA acetyltransferase